MGLDTENPKGRKHRSLKGLFSSSSSSLNKLSSQTSPGESNHRMFLRRNSSKGSLSEKSSNGSIGSFRKAKFGFGSKQNDDGSSVVSFNEHQDGLKVGDDNQSLDNATYDSTVYTGSDVQKGEKDVNGVSEGSSGSSHMKSDKISDSSNSSASKHSHIKVNHNSHGRRRDHLFPPKMTKTEHSNHSHLSLKRFFKKLKNVDTRTSSESSKKLAHGSTYSGTSNLSKKYVVGKLLGTGSSGSVNLATSKTTHKVYAIKKFRGKFKTESDSEYRSKVKNEFEIAKGLNHQNLIKVAELVKESASILADTEYYIVMEYCPYDFFNLVMSGLLNREECACYFKQIINGVSSLHEHGFAHRDLKLDNCIVDDKGILKLIDFGSSVKFKRNRISTDSKDDLIDEDTVLIRARGIVGSDPYLAPELFEPSNFGYDPRPVDVWSIAIIFCCITLHRFPWKIPKASDPAFLQFAEMQKEEDIDNITPLLLSDLKLSSDDNDKADNEERVVRKNKMMKLLPSNSQSLIKSMLMINPEKRITLEKVIDSDFYKSIDYCHYTDENHTMLSPAQNHIHHLVTEAELEEINIEKEREAKLKEAGVA